MYSIKLLETVVVTDIPALPKTMRLLIKKAIESRLTVDPVGFGKPLRFDLKGHRRLRVGDYRVIYRIDQDQMLVVIVAIKHRRVVYTD